MTTKEQYPGPYTAEYCRENRISIGPVNPEQTRKFETAFGLKMADERFSEYRLLYVRFYSERYTSLNNWSLESY